MFITHDSPTAQCRGRSACSLIALAMYAFAALGALPAIAAESALWQGGAEGIWGTGYEGNWTAYPTSNHYAQFGSPSDDPITVTVNESVDAYGV